MINPDTTSLQKSNNLHRIMGLLGIVVLAFALRWYNLPQRGIIARDEAWYTYSAEALDLRLHNRLAQEQVSLLMTNPDLPDFERISSNNVAGKPMYVAILWLLGVIRGSWNYDNVLGLSLFAGVANTLAIYWLSRQARLNVIAALLASLSGAVSFTSIYFSRIGYPYALLILSHTLALGFYIRADTEKPLSWSLFVAGLLWGIGLSLHMSLALALPGLLVGEIYQYRKNLRENVGTLLRRSFRWGGGILCVLLGWEILYRIAPYLIGHGSGLISLTGSFLGDLLKHIGDGGANSNPITNLLFYGFALLGLENPLTCILFLIGAISVWRMKGIGEGSRLLFLFLLTNLVFLIVYPSQYGRQLAPLMAIWPILVTIGLSFLIETLSHFDFSSANKNIRSVTVAIVVFILLFNIYWVWPILAAGSTGWVKAVRWIQANTASGDWIITSEISDAAILNYYLPGRVLVWPSEVGQLPPQVHWYIQNPTIRFVSASTQLQPLIAGRVPSASLTDPWLLLRPHSVIGGDWLLIPWWRWSAGPKSYQHGIDDVIQVYQIR